MVLHNPQNIRGIAYYVGRKNSVLCFTLLSAIFWSFSSFSQSNAAGFSPFLGKCDSNHFKCDNRCFPLSWKCDGDRDCSNGTDEIGCDHSVNKTTCSKEDFLCNNQCVPLTWKCDGDKDCKPDGFDEKGCVPITCPADKFQCKDSPRCIPTIWLCDGDEECEDGSDEINCDNYTCASNDFHCVNGKKCIKSSWVCDGYNDCGDSSDERNCNTTRPCSSKEFRCGNSLCVQKQWVCDGDNDCGDNSDEQANCTQKGCNLLTEFPCQNGQCISNLWRCDGSSDCLDGSDEIGCATCSPNMWQCIGTKKCITVSQVCDGQNDCGDNSDEGPHCMDDDCNSKNCSQLCLQTSSGAKCYCKSGYNIGKDNSSCEDIDECKNIGQCDHFCYNTVGSYRCKCDQGYVFEAPRSCKLKDSQVPWLIFATQNEIRKLTLDGKLYERAGNLTNPNALDFDMHDGKLYWSDMTDNTIYRTNYATNNASSNKPEFIVSAGVQTNGLAVDWIGRNLYFADRSARSIIVSKLDGRHRTYLITTNVNSPRDIAVDPRDGLLFWADTAKPRIERANLDGTNRIVLTDKNFTGINSITIDYTLRTLYWADGISDFIGSMSYNGENQRRIVGQPKVGYPLAITVFNNDLLFTERHAIVKMDKFTGKRSTLLLKDLTKPMAIKVYHKIRQPAAFNPCADNNCGCHQICLISARQTCTCKCEIGYHLGVDNKSCVKFKEFMLYSRTNEIVGIPLIRNSSSDVVLSMQDLGSAGCLDYDKTEGYLYFTDKKRYSPSVIRRVSLIGQKSQTLVKSNRYSPGFAVDWLGRNLYWIDLGLNEISVSKINGSFKKTLFYDQVYIPQAIVLHPNHGLIFWSDLGIPGKIETANLDGTQRHVVVQGKGEWLLAISLAVDTQTNELCWTDAMANVIECININGTNRRVLVKQIDNAYGFDMFNGYIYWSNATNKDIRKAPTNRLDDVMVIKSNLKMVLAIKVYSSERQIGTSSCSNGTSGCSHLCLLNPSGFSCDCPMGMALSDKDNKTCLSNDTASKFCRPGIFRCKNNRCISMKLTCDKVDDCFDNSDEDSYANCTIIPSCGPGNFQCEVSRMCLPLSMRCNGNDDCGKADDSDELNCPTNCTSDQFTCDDGDCIPKRWHCDGLSECTDGSDERGCGDRRCLFDQFSCNNGPCIPRDWVCDFTSDCADGSDEIDCPQSNCNSYNLFRCHDRSKCLLRHWRCDGDKDCRDGSDEWDCPTQSPDLCNSTTWFKCNNTRCIPKRYECDVHDDCGDGSDEHSGCSNITCNGTTQFMCSNNRCIDLKWRCDGQDDCGDASDEAKCGTISKSCGPNGWRCHNGLCINKTQVCDRNVHCPDSSDEGYGCVLNGCVDNGGCSQLCLVVPKGVLCYCRPGFKLAGDNKTCVDVDECKSVSACSQQCYNLIGSFQCACVDGYQLLNDRQHCKATGDHIPYLYFSTRSEIRKIDLFFDLEYNVEVSNINGVIGLDFDWTEQRIYWSDVVKGTLSRCFLNGTGQEDLITDALITTEGLAVDWIARRLYWLDMKADRIEVSTLDGKWRNVLISEDLKAPRGLALDPRDGYLFWSDWGTSRIERSFLDGTHRVQLVNKKIKWPNGLTLDFANRRVYWIDAHLDHLEFCNYDGNNRHLVLSGSGNIKHPFALTLFEDWVYWTDWHGKKVYKTHKTQGGELKSLFRGIMKPMDIHVVHPLRQPKGVNYCANATCSHLCLLVPHGYVCRCPIGLALRPDNTSCGDDFTTLLFATGDSVRGISLDPNNNVDTIVSMFGLNRSVSIDFDYKHGFVYWSDIKEETISRVSINGTSRQTILRDISRPEGIALDWIANNIYWTDLIKLFSESIGRPRAIVVHPVKGLLFWSDWDTKSPRLERSNLDGSSRRVLVSERLGFPNGLTIDYAQSQLYWCDANTKSIERVEFDGSKRKMIYSSKNGLSHLFGISVFADTLYWSDWTSKAIFFASKFGPQSQGITTLRSGIQHAFGVEVYSRRRQIGSNACSQSNGGCQHICLAKNATTRRCMCAIGHKLCEDQKSCEGINSFLLYSTPKAIYGISLDYKDNTSVMNPVEGMININSIDLFFNSSWIFYTDDRRRIIGRVNRDGTNNKVIIRTGLRQPQGIAVDWVGMNLYWTDAGTDLIEVSRLNGSSRHVVISTGLSEPRSIVVYPGKGLMYWTDWSRRRIERSSMDGSFRRVVASGSKIRRPSGLTIDYRNDMVYWADIRRSCIWSMDLDGGNQKRIRIRKANEPMGLSILGDLLYWANRNKSIMRSTNKTNPKRSGSKKRKIQGNARDIKVYDIERQPSGGVCEENGGCLDLCLAVSSARKRCACSSGRLGSDKRSCHPTSNYIILAQGTEFKFLSLVPGAPSPRPEITGIAPSTHKLAFDYDSGTVFFTESTAIKSMKIDGTGVRNVTSAVGTPGGIAVDWVDKYIYWTEPDLNNIKRVHFNGSLFKTVIKHGIVSPSHIAVLPCEKKVYWAEWSKQPSIKTAWSNGMGMKAIINHNLGFVFGLTIDYMEGRLYWADWQKIESAYLNGTNRKTVTISSTNAHSITIFGEFMYWINSQYSIFRASKYNGGDPVTMFTGHNIDITADILIYAKEQQDCTRNPCALNGGCTQVCSPNPNNGLPVCSCEPGYTLKEGYLCVNQNASCKPLEFTCTNGKCTPQLTVCDGDDDCGDGLDELPLVCANRKCGANQFKCNHGRCISKKWVCDGGHDCHDGSDEFNCPAKTCIPSQFQCANGDCINVKWKCDYSNDCEDGSDEVGCPTRQCAGNEFRCSNGRCKPYEDKCDGNNDCGDFSDEKGCGFAKCPSDRIKCNTTSICVDKSWLCDGFNDCGDNWDERKEVCSVNKCTGSEFRCTGSSRCIPRHWYCDGENDCSDHSDEPSSCQTEKKSCSAEHFVCNNGNCISRLFVCDGDDDCGDSSDEIPGVSLCPKRNCTGAEFKCIKSSRCIPLSYMCDGDDDCGDNSDEDPSLNCLRPTCGPSQFTCLNGLCIQKKWRCDYEDDCGDNSDEASCANHTCKAQQFQCKSGHCIQLNLKCNQIFDCVDGSDEDPSVCSVTPTPSCVAGTFKCANSKCIPLNQVCNNIDNCGDMSDERRCNINECELTNNKICAHLCNDTLTGYTCSCRPGYQLMTDGKSCKDVDECGRYSLNYCSQRCVNLEGSFKCTCALGYELEATNRTLCKATSKLAKPYIIFSERNQIRSMDLKGWYMDIIVSDAHPWALNFDMKEGRVYWTQGGKVSKVFRAFLDGSGSEIIIKTGIQSPEAIAVDWVGRNLYISDLVLNKVFVTTLTGKYMKTLLSGLQPRALVVYPEQGFLFYTNWGERPYIGRAGLDGSSSGPLVHAKMEWPTSLALCHLSKKLFWVDAKLHLVEYSNLDGSHRTQLPIFKVENPFGIAIFEDFVYWSDSKLKTINRSFKWTGGNHQILHKSTGKLQDIQVIHPSLQPQPTSFPCSKLACTGLCLLTPNGRAKCACSDSMYLVYDGRTCYENCTNNEKMCGNYKCIPRLWWCDGVSDCADSSDELTCPSKRRCPIGTHQCPDGHTCVSPFQICDGKNQCPSGDDERACSARQCTSYQFQCSNRRCIYKSRVCNRVDDCGDGSDEQNCPTATCSSSEHPCPNGRCIPKTWLCDGDNDCGDNTDEAPAMCPSTCSLGYFKCRVQYQCISQNWTCDGHIDCRDKSDEEKSLCIKDTCSSGMFRCKNKKCIPIEFQCDQHDDCGDRSDESSCKPISCLPHQSRCGTGRCITQDWMCNGNNDCGDNSDEKNCGPVSCRSGQAKCANGDCIEKGWWCDGKKDCQDASDEKDCSSRYPDGRSCSSSQYQCLNKVCISRTWMCDGQNDCGDNSDEIARLCEYHKCSKSQFRCKSFHCIPKWKVCDGVKDCDGNEDEKDYLCSSKPSLTRCTRDQFKCQNLRCINGPLVCNGVDECGDASDELLCVANSSLSCAVNNGGCSQLCRFMGNSVVCSCWPGFEYDSFKKKCIDINECLYTNPPCEQQCVNTYGSYKCTCTDGYIRSPDDKHRCKPLGGPPVLLFPSGSEIRRLVLSPTGTGDYDTGASDMVSVGSLDILAAEGILFWTDLHNKTIKRARIPESARHRNRRSLAVQDLPLPIGVSNGLAVDWIGNNIFWSESETRSISVARLDGRYRRTVVSKGLDDPGDVIVDSNKGLLFWTDRGRTPKIESSNMDGTNRTSLVTTQVIWPTGLALDKTTQQLYWADYKTGRVERIGTDGHGRTIVLKNVKQPSFVAVSGNFLYVTTKDRILQVDKYGLNMSGILVSGLQRLSSLRVQQKEHQRISPGSPCATNNGNCSHLCLAISTGHVCACPDGDNNEVQPCLSAVVEPRSPPACSLTACGIGTCLDVNGKAKCICPSGLTGPYCMTPTLPPLPTTRPPTKTPNVCLTISCYNGSVCIVHGGKPFCKCPQGTGGVNCEESCSTLQCSKGARCEAAGNQIYCRCKSGYRYTTGPGCESDPCLKYTQCGHDGQCYINGSTNKPYCKCSDGSTAVSCKNTPKVLGQSNSSDNVLPQIIIPVVMAFLVALVITVFVCCRRQRPNKPSHYCGMNVHVGNPSFMYEEMPDDNISIVSREYTRNDNKGTNFSNPVYESIHLHNISSSTALLADHEYISDFSWHNVDFTNPMYEALYDQRHGPDVLFRSSSSTNMNGNTNQESFA